MFKSTFSSSYGLHKYVLSYKMLRNSLEIYNTMFKNAIELVRSKLDQVIRLVPISSLTSLSLKPYYLINYTIIPKITKTALSYTMQIKRLYKLNSK